MKKLLSLLLSVFLLAALTIPAAAAETTVFTVKAEKTAVSVTDEVKFTVTLQNSKKLTSLGMLISYDKSVWELVDGTCTVTGAAIANWNGDGFAAVFASATAYSGPVGSFTLRIKNSATVGKSTEVGALGTSVRNGLKSISNTVTAASVKIQEARVETTPMYRLYNPNSGEHFYTGSNQERDYLVNAGWKYEGVAWNAPVSIGEPVYRVFNPNSGDHHYTMSQQEVNKLMASGWRFEGVAWNSAPQKHTESVPQYRLYNPNADLGSHHYTSSPEERDNLVKEGWNLEGIGWFGMVK